MQPKSKYIVSSSGQPCKRNAPLAVFFIPFFNLFTHYNDLRQHKGAYNVQEDDTIMRTGACYIRVSTDRQEELSPDAQKRLLLDYARENDIIITEDSIYYELGISGRKTDNRPAFRQMIAAAKSQDHPYDVILVWKFSRFARNQEESIVYKSLLARSNVEVISVSEPLPDGILGKLIERILEWMDEYYSIRLSGEVMRGMTEKALRGGYQSVPPLGYDRIRGQAPTVNESEAEIVRMIFHMFVDEDRSLFAICKFLNLGKYPTKRGAHWNATHLRYLLGNPFYIGKVRWNYCYHHQGDHRKPEDECIIADGVHEPLIDIATFEASEKKLKMINETKATQHQGRQPAKHWLSGKFFCSKCGSHMVYRSPTSRNNAAFHCHGKARGICDRNNRITVPRLEHDLLAGLEMAFTTCQFDYVKKELPVVPTNINAILKEQIADLDKKERRIRKAYMDGIDTLEEYKESRALISKQREDLTAKLAAIENPSTAVTDADRRQLVQRIHDVWELLQDDNVDMLKKSDAIKGICEKITYDKEQDKLAFYFKV